MIQVKVGCAPDQLAGHSDAFPLQFQFMKKACPCSRNSPDVDHPPYDLDFVTVNDLSVYRDIDVFVNRSRMLFLSEVLKQSATIFIFVSAVLVLQSVGRPASFRKLINLEFEAIPELMQWMTRLQSRFCPRRADMQGLQSPPLLCQPPMLQQPQSVNVTPRQFPIIGPLRSSTPSPIHHTRGETCYHPAQAVFEPDLIVTDCQPSENVDDGHPSGDPYIRRRLLSTLRGL